MICFGFYDSFSSYLDSLWSILNSNFSTAFFGAIAGSLTIIFISWVGEQRKILADINTSIGMLSSLLNTSLNIKRQHSLPLKEEYLQHVNTYQNVKNLKSLGVVPSEPITITYTLKLDHFSCPKLHFDLPLERIFTLADKHPQFVQILMQTKVQLYDLEEAYTLWNNLVKEIKDLPEEQRLSIYFGTRSNEGVRNTFFVNSVENLQMSVDGALFFTKNSIDVLSAVAKKALPFWLRKKVAKFEIADEYLKLMPSDEQNKDWKQQQFGK